MLVFVYPMQYSTVPKILRDFIIENKDLWQNKKVFVIATMGLFSGDGAGILGRLLHQYGAKIIGGPKQAMTLFGKNVVEQSVIEKYL